MARFELVTLDVVMLTTTPGLPPEISNNVLYTTGVGNIDSMNYENTVPLLELCPPFFSLDIF